MLYAASMCAYLLLADARIAAGAFRLDQPEPLNMHVSA
jgi:hypothetical protein